MADASAQPGQTIYDSPLGSATVINRVVEAANDFAYRKRLGTGGGGVPWTIPTDLIKVKNETGADRSAGAVVELGEYQLDDVTRDHLIVEGIAVSAQGVPNVAVLLKAHPEHDILPAQVSGVCVATVNVVNADDRCCYVKEGEYRFTSCAIGHHRLLQAPTTAGEQLCLVGLGTGVMSALCKPNSTITPGSEADTGQDIAAVWNHGPDAPATDLAVVGILGGRFYLSLLECAS
jgi:hypothetical protein